ncbi:hypothetical protein, partial [Stenotrophomonas sp. NPDC077659]|uniref:hypothetical protein n=1 Tax=Stenotrophomonas sp. NPDC077659 TaxID=3390694 RepID=UPI003D0908EE
MLYRVLHSFSFSPTCSADLPPFDTGAAHHAQYLSADALATLVNRQIPDATLDTARQQAREALND